MIISELYKYYGQISKKLPDTRYEIIKINYLICLDSYGTIKDILPYESIEIYKGKERRYAKEELFPNIPSSPKVISYPIEYRYGYLFGLKAVKNEIIVEEKKWESFKEINLKFLENVDSKLANAFRNYIIHNNSNDFSQDERIININSSCNFAFCLYGEEDKLLNNDEKIREKWESMIKGEENNDESASRQCAITGEFTNVVRLNDKLKGIKGANSVGAGFVCFNENAFESYNFTQGENCTISEQVMKKYTKAFNYLTNNYEHKTTIGDLTLLYWSEQYTKDKINENAFLSLISPTENDEEEKKMQSIMKQVAMGYEPDFAQYNIDGDVNFNIIGVTPNSSRLCIKFHFKNTFAHISKNIIQHNNDLLLKEDNKQLSLWQLSKSLISPVANESTYDIGFISAVLKSIITGTMYPEKMLSNAITRVKTDTKKEYWQNTENNIRMIKAYLNRKYKKQKKEELIKMSLDLENKNVAYLCGRLFAILEKVQEQASGGKLNSTIKDRYFTSVCASPAMVFSEILKLAQNHLSKIGGNYFQIMIANVIEDIPSFPKHLTREEQGIFIIGYYQQRSDFFKSKKDKENDEEGEN